MGIQYLINITVFDGVFLIDIYINIIEYFFIFYEKVQEKKNEFWLQGVKEIMNDGIYLCITRKRYAYITFARWSTTS